MKILSLVRRIVFCKFVKRVIGTRQAEKLFEGDIEIEYLTDRFSTVATWTVYYPTSDLHWRLFFVRSSQPSDPIERAGVLPRKRSETLYKLHASVPRVFRSAIRRSWSLFVFFFDKTIFTPRFY